MQVLDATVCQLSNFEAYTVLEDWRKNRRAQEILPSGSVFELEKRLLKSDSMRGERLLSRDQVEGFLAALDELCTQYTAGVDGETFYLSVAEKIQILNLKPTSVVLLENIVEGLASEERLCAADVESFGSAVIGLVCAPRVSSFDAVSGRV